MRWKPFQVALFDCDSTLSAVEGIDVLTDDPTTRAAISELTDLAMEGEVPLEDVYGERLAMINPTRREMRAVKNQYKAAVVPDAVEVLAALTAADIETWVISGGLLEPVVEFATWLGVSADRVKAVEAEFDPLDGNWWEPSQAEARYLDYDRGDLARTDGKASIIESNVATEGRRLFVGDGASDLAAASAVDLFVAYAGVVERADVVAQAPAVITSRSLAPVLALALGRDRVKELIGTDHDVVARTCLESIDAGSLQFNDVTTERAFDAS